TRRGSVKMPSYLLPSLHEALATDRPHGLLLLAVAAWMRYLRGTDLAGNRLALDDPRLPSLQALLGNGADPRRLLGMRSVFGRLGARPDVVAGLPDLLRLLDAAGLDTAVAGCLPGTQRLVA